MYSFTYHAHIWASVSVYVSGRCSIQLIFGDRISQVSHWTSMFQRDYLDIESIGTIYPCPLAQWLQVSALHPSFFMSTIDPNKSMSSYLHRENCTHWALSTVHTQNSWLSLLLLPIFMFLCLHLFISLPCLVHDNDIFPG